jgi:hypothetical protein
MRISSLYRLGVCTVLIRNMIDRIERDEKREIKLAGKTARKQESVGEKKQKYRSAKLYGLLYKEKDNLHREMLKKRMLLEQSMENDIRVNVSHFSLFVKQWTNYKTTAIVM